jgi:hypothetical protein
LYGKLLLKSQLHLRAFTIFSGASKRNPDHLNAVSQSSFQYPVFTSVAFQKASVPAYPSENRGFPDIPKKIRSSVGSIGAKSGWGSRYSICSEKVIFSGKLKWS